MKITKKSPFTGQLNTLDIDVKQEDLDRYNRGEDLIQNIFPNLSADEREFIMTGISPEDWKNTFGNSEK